MVGALVAVAVVGSEVVELDHATNFRSVVNVAMVNPVASVMAMMAAGVEAVVIDLHHVAMLVHATNGVNVVHAPLVTNVDSHMTHQQLQQAVRLHQPLQQHRPQHSMDNHQHQRGPHHQLLKMQRWSKSNIDSCPCSTCHSLALPFMLIWMVGQWHLIS